jgi:hypothetical protein
MKGKKNLISVTAKERGETVSVATGIIMPPYVIFKGKHLR